LEGFILFIPCIVDNQFTEFNQKLLNVFP